MDDDYKKVGYDARLQYYEVLRKLMIEASRAALMGDHPLWYKGLRLIYSMIKPYIRKVDVNELDDLFLKANNLLLSRIDNRYSNSVNNKVYSLLTLIDDRLHISARDMFLPTADREADDIDWDEFLRGSDL